MRDRKRMDLDGKEGGEELKGIDGRDMVFSYITWEKNLCLVKWISNKLQYSNNLIEHVVKRSSHKKQNSFWVQLLGGFLKLGTTRDDHGKTRGLF